MIHHNGYSDIYCKITQPYNVTLTMPLLWLGKRFPIPTTSNLSNQLCMWGKFIVFTVKYCYAKIVVHMHVHLHTLIQLQRKMGKVKSTITYILLQALFLVMPGLHLRYYRNHPRCAQHCYWEMIIVLLSWHTSINELKPKLHMKCYACQWIKKRSMTVLSFSSNQNSLPPRSY